MPDPLQLVLNGLLTTRVLTRFLLKPLALLFKIGRIIAFVDKITATIEFEYPANDVVEEVAIVGYKNNVTLIIDEVLFKPSNRFRIKVVGRFVQQQDVRLFEQKTRQGYPALFTARQICNGAIGRRTTQCIHREFKLAIQTPAIHGIDLFLQCAHFFHQGIKIRIGRWVPHQHRNLVKPVHQIGNGAHPVHYILPYGLVRIQFRLLRKVTHANMFAWPSFTRKLRVHTSHDFHQGRFTGAVGANDTDFGIGVKLQIDVIKNGLVRAGEGFGHSLHYEAILRCHLGNFPVWDFL